MEPVVQIKKTPIKVSKTAVWIIRGILFLLFVIWVGGALYLYSFVREDNRELERLRLARQQQEERLRRAASYESSRIEQKLNKDSSKNAVDSFKR